jgi:lipoprotein-anchoring transpeptidase ErfK/SrfK
MLTRRNALSYFIGSGFLFGQVSSGHSNEPFKVKDETKAIDFKWRRKQMAYDTAEPPGTIIVDSSKRFLYHVQEGGEAMRYGVAIGKSAQAWTGEVIIKKMTEWPTWTPAPYHLELRPDLIKWKDGMPGGLDNPMGARAMYLYKGDVDTINRIHGSAKPGEIGKKATGGCIGMLNIDVIHLYSQVQVGTRVLMV